MADINKIEELAQSVANANCINVLPKRCSYIRSWNSKCRKCINACQHDAIVRSVGRLSINPELCTGCGACVAACPTSALGTLAPTQTEIVRQARQCAQNYGNMAVFACLKDAQALSLDPELVCVLPCLNYLDEYLICGLFSCGIQRIALVNTGCEGCQVDCPEPYFTVVVKSAQNLSRLWGTGGKVKVFGECPDNLRSAKRKHKAADASQRRETLAQTKSQLMGYVAQSFDEFIDPTQARKRQALQNQKVTVSCDEKFDASTYRSNRLISMLDRVGTRPEGQILETRLWAAIDVDLSKCSHCGSCARMCATGALDYQQPGAVTAKDQQKMPATLSFTPSKCVACGQCRDICIKKALVMGNRVPASDLDADVTYTLFENERPVSHNPFGV